MRFEKSASGDRRYERPGFRAISIMLLAVLPGAAALGQPYVLSGFVTDSTSREVLVGAHVFDPGSNVGAVTNDYGFFSLRLSEDSTRVRVSHVGYQSRTFVATRMLARSLEIQLIPQSAVLDTIEVNASTAGLSLEDDPQMSRVTVSLTDVQNLPVLLGEADLMKTLQLMPGVQSGAEGTSGLYVRGGSPDQNLILLDGAPVYNVAHLFGFFSTFNADALNSVSLYKGGFPARYGGRLSSVLDVQLREGNRNEFEGRGSVGLIASRLTLEGPIYGDRSSFLISGRRTYLDLLTYPIQAAQGNDGIVGYYFYDLNGKANVQATQRDRFYLSLYLGDDRFFHKLSEGGSDSRFLFGWGNTTATLRWSRILNSSAFANATLVHSRFRYLLEDRETSDAHRNEAPAQSVSQYVSSIRDWSGRVDVDYLPNPKHALRFGISVTHHRFRPGIRYFEDGSTTSSEGQEADQSAVEGFVYVEDEIKLAPRISANIGVNASAFRPEEELYASVEPRLTTRFSVANRWALKVSFATMRQYLHLLTHSGTGLPTDLWVPSTDRVGPESAWQVAAGVVHSTGDGAYEVGLEGYYKPIRGIIEYREGAGALSMGTEWEDAVVRGRGLARGLEWFLQKRTGRTTGWIGYTLSWSSRRFPSLNQGRTFPFRYDRRHDVSVVVTRKLRINTLSVAWVYGTGNAVTLPIGHYEENGRRVDVYDRRNGVRMRAYHRLDVSIHTPRRNGKSRTTLSVFNLYNRRNPLYVYVDERAEFDPESGFRQQVRQVRQVSLFPVIPSISYQFTF